MMVVGGLALASLLAALLAVFLSRAHTAQLDVSDPGAAYSSSPYYPARIFRFSTLTLAIGRGAGKWTHAYAKASAMVEQMTVLEKVWCADRVQY
jgi:hypothetical protein